MQIRSGVPAFGYGASQAEREENEAGIVVDMSSPVVVDGRLDREKLLELLAIGAEHDELDFKATLDLKDVEDRFNFVKDIIAMMNTATGGYIVLGASDDGRAAAAHEPLDVRAFDSADLAQYVARHISAQPRVTSQAHTIEGHAFIVVHVSPTISALPTIISKVGEFTRKDGKTKVILREGVLYTREGTRNVAANDTNWHSLLARYRAGIVAETRENLDDLVKRVVEAIGTSGASTSLPPLLLAMDNSSFTDSIRQHIDAKSEATLQRFIREARKVAAYRPDGSSTERDIALDKLAIAAIETMRSRRDDDFEGIISALHDSYLSAGPVDEYATSLTDVEEVAKTQFWLDVLIRVWLIGAAAQRERRWDAIATVASRPVALENSDAYPSWLRHGIVYASRAGLFPDENRGGALVLSMAREHAHRTPELADDLPGLGDLADPVDPLLDSLARFDILWCLVLAIGRTGADLAYRLYPSAAALLQERSNPALKLVATSRAVRDELVPGATDEQYAVALRDVLELAVVQSRNHGTFWRGIHGDRDVFTFVSAHSGGTA